MSLLDYQVEPCGHLDRILREYGAALDGSDTGTGKTYVAVNVAKRLGLPFAVICPKSVIPSWERVCAEEGIEPQFILNYEKLIRGNTPWVAKAGATYEWAFQGFIIWDEVHRCRTHNSQNAKLLIAAWNTQLIRCLLVSATAAQNPLEMRALGYVLGLHRNKDFWPWVYKLGARKDRWGGYAWKGEPAVLKGIHDEIFPRRGVRVRIADLGKKFPENQIIPEVVQVDNGESLKIYEDAKKELERLKEQEEVDMPSAFTIILRARQKLEILKVPLIVERTRQLLDEGRSVVIFCNFNATLDTLAALLGTDCVIRGQLPAERIANIANFQSDLRRVCIANIQAGGVGVSLHDLHGNFPRTSIICPTFDGFHLRQALGRIHRSGGKSACQQYLLYAAGTIEERACLAVKAKLDNMDLLNDDDISDDLTFQPKHD